MLLGVLNCRLEHDTYAGGGGGGLRANWSSLVGSCSEPSLTILVWTPVHADGMQEAGMLTELRWGVMRVRA